MDQEKQTAVAWIQRAIKTTFLQRGLSILARNFYERLVPVGLFVILIAALGVLSIPDVRVSALGIGSPEQSAPQEPSGDFSKFRHNNAQHARLPCALCHRRESNAARPTLPGKSGHAPCAGCHAQQFSNSNSPICGICHDKLPAGTVKAFPRLQSFNVKFDHARHTAAGAACVACHRQNHGGVAKSIPAGLNAHTICFACHTPTAQSNGRNLSSCGTCHALGRLVRTTERAPAFRVGFSHAKHDASEKLRCIDCHQVRAGLPLGRQVVSPVPLNHRAPIGARSCASCHNGKRTFGGDDFSACTRCHKGSEWRF